MTARDTAPVTEDTAPGAASARALITVTAQNVPPERQAAVTAHIEGWLTRWLSTGVRLADSETGIDYTLTATSDHASYQGSEHGELRDQMIEVAEASESDTLFSSVLERAGWMQETEMDALFGLLHDIRSGDPGDDHDA